MKKRIPLLLIVLLAGCSHGRSLPTTAIPRPVAVAASKLTPTRPAPPLKQAGSPGALRYWKAASNYVESLAFSPDGKRLATPSEENQVNVWGASTGKLLRSYHFPNTDISVVAYAPNGRWLAVAGEQGKHTFLNIINVDTGRLIRSIPTGPIGYGSLQFSRDSSRLMARGDVIALWDTESWHNLYHTKTADSTVFTVDGRYLLRCSTEGKILVCNTQTGRIVKYWQEPRPTGNYWYSLQAISDDGKFLAVALSEERHIISFHSDTQFEVECLRIINAQNGHPVRVFRGEKINQQAAFSPRRATVANWDFDNRGPDQLAFWNLRTGQYKQVYNEGVMCAAFSPNGKIVAMGDTSGGISLFRVPSWK